GWADLAAVHAAARRRADAARAEELAARRREMHAPDGLDALREALAGYAEAGATEDAPPPREEAERALATARATLAEAENALAKAQERAEIVLPDEGRAEAALAAARGQVQKSEAAVAGLDAEDEAATQERLDALDKAAREALAELDRLRAQVPDLGSLQARRDRLKAVVDRAAADAEQLQTENAKIDGRIETRAEEGIEEELAAVRDQLREAVETRDRIAFEVKVLRRLRDALDAAKTAARETYFEPIRAEMQPLLRDLWEDVEIEWSDDTLLPVTLVRRGTAEPIDVLSGGTQEQIAFFVRLAFARLLAKAGRPAPLILDDALVYSDDDRIERMFDALHRAAGDLQIIVLSCRQRAFRDLGAVTLGFERVEPV
ncbi:ATP-binding protein, partial [Roseobacter sp. HKCCA0434]|uniref:ATP-binding protein n=1 Tax=Roseobacter sp. HKCCA0434 TaxID=3079297 RepID=UPI0039671BD1